MKSIRSAVKITKNKSLKPLTTFKIGGPAKFFCEAGNAQEIRAAAEFAKNSNEKILVLGGGSNVLISDKGFSGLVIHPKMKGIKLLKSGSAYLLTAQAGENWDDVVAYAVRMNLWGIENLSHIPGQTGAAVVQNIGAYGQELADVFVEAEIFNLKTFETRKLSNTECKFGYRRSIFNTSEKGHWAILSITLKLIKDGKPDIKYRDLQNHFAGKTPKLKDVRDAIIKIRDNKYPFPKTAKNGSAGSFFKNFQLGKKDYAAFEKKFKKNFSASDFAALQEIVRKGEKGIVKIPTAFLLDRCGLKGYSNKGAKINEKQPLVILNKGRAEAKDVLALVDHASKKIKAKTGLILQIEPELIGFK